MATKETVVIILDVGRTMARGSLDSSNATSSLEIAIKAVNSLVQQKILFGKNDELGLVLCGSQTTQNQLSDGDDYQHIEVVRDIGFADLDLLRIIEKIEPGGEDGDLVDALIVGMDLILKKQALDPKKKFQKRIFVVTDAGCAMNTDGLDTILGQFNNMDARLNIIGVDFDEEDQEGNVNVTPGKSQVKQQNEAFLRDVAAKVKGVIVPVTQALEMMSYFRSKAVLQRTTYRGCLEIGKDLKIPIWSYVKVMPVKFPSLMKISTVSQESANPGGMGVVMERVYQSLTDPDAQVSAEERVKGYRYGKTLVPFTGADESQLKYEADSCMKVIGFTNSKNVPRYHFMGNSEMMVAKPDDKSAKTAMSALIHALAETDSVAIVRYVKRARSIPHLGVLIPHIKPDLECFYYCSLPFAEDLRQYAFPSLAPDRARKAFVPSQEQLNAAEELINSLDLTKADQDADGNPIEALKAKYTYNPILQRFYQAVQTRALKPDSPIPPLDPVIERYVNPDTQLFHKAESFLKSFKEKFPLEKSEKITEKNDRVYWKDSLSANQIKLDSYIPDPSKKRKLDGEYEFSLEQLLSTGVSEVGSIKPAEDFKEMLARRDVDLVDKAMEGMQKRIMQLVNDSVLSQLYPKALECLQTFREGAIREEESSVFNNFLKEMRSAFEGKRRDDFWKLVVNRGISLIHSDESDDSNISPRESEQFLSGPQVVDKPVAQPKLKESNDEVDDLLDMVE